jgi:hypothetical protein
VSVTRKPMFRAAVLAAAFASTMLVPMAQAEVRITPRIEVRQVFGDTFDGGAGSDPGMLTVVSPGVSIQVRAPRADAFIEASYERRMPIATTVTDRNRLNLTARITLEPVEDLFFVDAGGAIFRQALNSRGFIPLNPDIDTPNQATTYNFFVSPRLERRVNEWVSVGAGYTLSGNYYTGRNVDQFVRFDPNAPPLPGFGFGDFNTNQLSHNSYVSLTSGPAWGNVRWTARGGYEWTDRDRFDGRYRTYNGRLDGEYALTRQFSVVGSVGYEDILDRENGLLLDANGRTRVDPVTGRILEDPANRVTVFSQDGVIWDAGIRWSPSQRTEFTVRGGRRYGDTVLNGQLRLQPARGVSVIGSYGESLQNDGRLVTESIAGRSVSQFAQQRQGVGIFPFLVGFDPITNTPITGQLAINSANFLQRNGSIGLTVDRRGYTASLALFYDSRKPLRIFTLPGQAPIDPAVLDERDNSYGVTTNLTRRFNERSSGNFGITVRRNEFNVLQDQNDWLYGLNVGYQYRLSDNIQASATFFQSWQRQRFPGQTGLSNTNSDTTFTLGVVASF